MGRPVNGHIFIMVMTLLSQSFHLLYGTDVTDVFTKQMPGKKVIQITPLKRVESIPSNIECCCLCLTYAQHNDEGKCVAVNFSNETQTCELLPEHNPENEKLEYEEDSSYSYYEPDTRMMNYWNKYLCKISSEYGETTDYEETTDHGGTTEYPRSVPPCPPHHYNIFMMQKCLAFPEYNADAQRACDKINSDQPLEVDSVDLLKRLIDFIPPSIPWKSELDAINITVPIKYYDDMGRKGWFLFGTQPVTFGWLNPAPGFVEYAPPPAGYTCAIMVGSRGLSFTPRLCEDKELHRSICQVAYT